MKSIVPDKMSFVVFYFPLFPIKSVIFYTKLTQKTQAIVSKRGFQKKKIKKTRFEKRKGINIHNEG